MSHKKYLDFVESDPVTKSSKKAPWAPMTFVAIKCPHCNQTFTEIPVDNLKTGKASQCLSHLRLCEAYRCKGGEVAPKGKLVRVHMEADQDLDMTRKQCKVVREQLVTIYKLEDSIKDVDDMCRDLLRDLDRAGDRVYSANEVFAMLNAVREKTVMI